MKPNLVGTSGEHRLLSALDHDKVIRCYGGRIEADRAYVILERAMGPLWPRRHEEGVLPCFPNARWLGVLRDVARGMVHRAKRGVVYRDLTVQNLLYREEPGGGWTVKVSDFGVAGWLADDRDVVRGAMRHYPPEAILKQGRNDYTEKADVFLFGYLIQDLVLGAMTWTREQTSQAIAQTLAGERPEMRAPCLPEVRSLRDDCRRYRAEDRPTFREILQRLEDVQPA